MRTLAERVIHARQRAGIDNVAELARRIGVKPQAIYLIENGSTKSLKADTAVALARELDVAVEWLTKGLGPTPNGAASVSAPEPVDVDNASVASADIRRIPVISYVQAGVWTDVADPYPRGQGMGTVGADAELATKLSRVTFALKIEGDSMVAPSGDGFWPGEIIIVDPEASVRPGDFVVAKLEAEEKATFKKFRDRGAGPAGTPRFELVPLNPDYPTINVDEANPGRIIGVMVEHRRGRRR